MTTRRPTNTINTRDIAFDISRDREEKAEGKKAEFSFEIGFFVVIRSLNDRRLDRRSEGGNGCEKRRTNVVEWVVDNG